MLVNNQKTITPKQKKVLDFIQKFAEENGYSPSLSEISKFLEKSITTAQHFIEELTKRGYLMKKDNIARGIQALSKPQGRIFLLGYIAAGEPIIPMENPESLDVPVSMIEKQGEYYALRVKGDSMTDDNISDGDTIVVKYQQNADDGDRIVAITEKGATLKIFRNRQGKIYLEPRNKKYKNIYPKRLEIRGKFCGLIRNV